MLHIRDPILVQMYETHYNDLWRQIEIADEKHNFNYGCILKRGIHTPKQNEKLAIIEEMIKSQGQQRKEAM